ncbi:hypothetical protein [Methylomarinum vadi]|uniref:hypothetical protein n=1 Tax=Methylomarinum vadi TaxID=438855 RepID=UPI001268F201|nr:hypothetical protein [Methylomarinum vadi]
MNKITPHLLRDLHATLPAGTECYLCSAVRKALTKYRKGRVPMAFLDKEQALPLLAKKLGRGLKRFLRDDIRSALSSRKRNAMETMLKHS